jgi:hypothetical protein
MFNVGAEIKWVSQSGGMQKEKRGKLIGTIIKGESGFRVLNKATGLEWYGITARVKFQDTNVVSDRYLVEVPRGGRSVLTDFYAPQMSVIDAQNA